MTEVRDPESMIEAAQKAVAAEDYSAAEQLLRDAAARQEASLGESHPDLASTLNNLAFVCERLNKFDDAERGYRRAHAIAVASLSPGHPLIATSLKNLLEFCAARDIPIWTPPAPRAGGETRLSEFASESSESDESESDDFAPEAEPVAPVPAAVASRMRPRLIAVTALVAIAIVVVLVARQGRGTTEPSPPPSPPSSPAPSPPPVAGREPRPEPQVPPTTSPPEVAAERPRPASNAPVTVLKAQLCRAIAKRGSPDWQCTEATGDSGPGTYSFYTRLQATSDTTVEHRWYFSDRVHQVMRLRVPASPGNGYRTFSSNSVSAERAGEWKVELRAADGSVLHEEQFVVR